MNEANAPAPANADGLVASLSIVLPCYNEEANVSRVVEEALLAGGRVANQLEIVIVDDGSVDRTPDIVSELAKKHPQVKSIRLAQNQGYGGALQAGLKAASQDLVFYTDGDGQFDIFQLRDVLPLLNECDAIAGYRLNRQDNWRRRLSGWMWTMLVNVVFGFRFRDVDCAFKIFPRAFLQSIEIRSRGALISAELLAKAKRAGLKIRQVGVKHRPRVAGTSTGGDFKVICRAFRELLILRRHIRDSK